MTPSQAIAKLKAKGLTVTDHGTANLGMLRLPKHKAKSVSTSSPVRWAIEFSLPCRVLSEANKRDHWAKEHKRKQEQRAALTRATCDLKLHLLDLHERLPVTVELWHIGPTMDGDNLQRAFKAIRDAIAQWLNVDDADPQVTWDYKQRRGENGVEVRIESRAGQ